LTKGRIEEEGEFFHGGPGKM